MARRRYSGARGQAWGNAKGGYRTQRRINGKFSSGKGPSIKRASASQRRAVGYQKKKAADTRRANTKQRNRNVGIGLVVGAAVVAGGAYAVHKNGGLKGISQTVGTKGTKTSTALVPYSKPRRPRGTLNRAPVSGRPIAPPYIPGRFKSEREKIIGTVSQIRAQNAEGYTVYSGKEQVWSDPNNRSKKLGTLVAGAKSNGSEEIYSGALKVHKAKSIKRGGKTSAKSVTGTKANAATSTPVTQSGVRTALRVTHIKPSTVAAATYSQSIEIDPAEIPVPYSPIGFKGAVLSAQRGRTERKIKSRAKARYNTKGKLTKYGQSKGA